LAAGVAAAALSCFGLVRGDIPRNIPQTGLARDIYDIIISGVAGAVGNALGIDLSAACGL